MDMKWLCGLGILGPIEFDVPMCEKTTMRVGGSADAVVYAAESGDVLKTVAACRARNVPLYVIGRGSNLVVRDGGLRGVVLLLGRDFGKIEVSGDHIFAQAGAALTALSRAARDHSLTGLEFAEGIPGSVGGGVFMNAGAYGGEVKNVLVRAEILMPDGKIRDFSAEELELRYRHSVLMENGGLVLGAEFALQPGNTEQITAQMEELSKKRREKQPLQYPSAGSFFKRPEGYFAGKLIEDAGLKGARVGGAQISELHAGFLINEDRATAAEITALMEKVQTEVQKQFGVRLEPEVRFIGEEKQN